MSKSNAAAALGKLLGAHRGQHAESINVAMPCKVLAFDAVRLTANVHPLIKTGVDNPAPLLNVPVTGMRVMLAGAETVLRPALRAGDTVLVVFCDGEIKNTLSGQVAAPDSRRKHSRNDGVIVGLMPCCL